MQCLSALPSACFLQPEQHVRSLNVPSCVRSWTAFLALDSATTRQTQTGLEWFPSTQQVASLDLLSGLDRKDISQCLSDKSNEDIWQRAGNSKTVTEDNMNTLCTCHQFSCLSSDAQLSWALGAGLVMHLELTGMEETHRERNLGGKAGKYLGTESTPGHQWPKLRGTWPTHLVPFVFLSFWVLFSTTSW